MKISENWLRQWVSPNIDGDALAEQLTMAGLEVDDKYAVAKDFNGVVVAEVISVEPHPNADKLRVAQVNTGSEQVQIVCGAPNVQVGMKAPLATIGAQLPNPDGSNGKPFQIKKSKLRGVESQGMLCGGSEIDCDDGVDGLLHLPDDAPVGMDIREYLGLDNQVLDISITPNRGDCFSVRGIARELAVINNLPLIVPKITTLTPSLPDAQDVQVMAIEQCPLYLAQPVLNIDRDVATPKWMLDALLQSGFRTHNFLVDVTNYVLMELGQPLHAFDKDQINGQIVVRLAKPQERLTLLNDDDITLTGDELVMADDKGAIALAGIMGGKRTAVTDTTTNVVLESAFFAPLALAGRARRFGLHTDASQRFERGVDFELPQMALSRAVQLLKDIAGGQLGVVSEVKVQDKLPKRLAIDLRLEQVQKLLGVDIERSEIERILKQLGLVVTDNKTHLQCTPPSWRYDLSLPEDLIEEIARIHGYDNISNQLPRLMVNMRYDDHDDRLFDLKMRLVEAGYAEAVTFSFSDAKLEQILNDDDLGAMLTLANPISSDLAVMRRTLLSSLLPSVQFNLNRQQSRVRLFETGLTFVGSNVAQLKQTPSIALVAVGTAESERNASMNTSRTMDFFDLKHDIERLFPNNWVNVGAGHNGESSSRLMYQRSQWAFLHPGQSADIYVNGQAIGWLGQLHPSIANALDLPTTWVAQLASEALIEFGKDAIHITPLSKFPQVRRDIAILVNADIALQSLTDTIRQSAGELLVDSWLFDVYAGEHVPTGQRSLAFALVYQDINNTLDDVSVATLTQTVVDALIKEHQAVLRDS